MADLKLHKPGSSLYEAAIDAANLHRRRIGLLPIDREDLGDEGMSTAELVGLVQEATDKHRRHDRVRFGTMRSTCQMAGSRFGTIREDSEPDMMAGCGRGSGA